MNALAENQILKFISNQPIINRTILSNSFDIICEKITLDNHVCLIAKYYDKKNLTFNAIKSEGNSLIYMSKKFPNLFPTIKLLTDDVLIMNFIEHNNIISDNYQNVLAKEILKIHSVTNDKYGFDFDAQIGGLKQSNTYELNWIDFFTNKRLSMIFEKINKDNPMPKSINQKIEKLMRDMKNHLPRQPNISLLHGDLWEGNILFKDGELAGLIDPGIYFGHHELEIAYLTWFKFVDEIFLDFYSNFIKIDKYFIKYEPIYQLYFSLLNVGLWNRELYLKDTENLLNKIFKHTD